MTQFLGGMGGGGTFAIDGEPREVPSFAEETAVDERYFTTIGLPLLAGRNFTSDDRETAPPVAIVSASFGRFLAHGGNPIGHRIAARGRQGAQHAEVVGVVPDVITSVRRLEPLVIYKPLSQQPDSSYRTVVIRAASDAAVAMREAVATVRSMEPAIAMPEFQTIDDHLGEQMGPQRFGATVLGALGGIALLLTLFGIYVLVESMSAMRRREMGVRAALGATRRQLGALVLGDTVRLICLGIGTGLLLAWFGSALIRAFLFHVEPFDVVAIGCVVAAMTALALLVSLRPAMHAARVDLARVLREE